MTEKVFATRAASTNGIAIPGSPHVVGAPMENADAVAWPSTGTVLARTIAHIRGAWTVIDPPIKMVQLAAHGSYFTALVVPECDLPAIGERVLIEPRRFSRSDSDSFSSLVVVDRERPDK